MVPMLVPRILLSGTPFNHFHTSLVNHATFHRSYASNLRNCPLFHKHDFGLYVRLRCSCCRLDGFHPMCINAIPPSKNDERVSRTHWSEVKFSWRWARLHEPTRRRVVSTQPHLQKAHDIRVTSQITDNLTVCSTAYMANNKRNIKYPHYWVLVNGIHQSLVDPPFKGPVMRKALAYHDVSIKHTYTMIRTSSVVITLGDNSTYEPTNNKAVGHLKRLGLIAHQCPKLRRRFS